MTVEGVVVLGTCWCGGRECVGNRRVALQGLEKTHRALLFHHSSTLIIHALLFYHQTSSNVMAMRKTEA